MSRLRVDTDSMQKLDTNLKEWVEETASLMKQMRESTEALHATWEGLSYDEFMQSFTERKEAVKAKALTLEKFSGSFSQAVRLYLELEQEVADTVSTL